MIHNGRTINVATYCIERKNPKGNESLRYVLEVENCCPKCGKVIMNFSADKKKLYEIAHIFPNRPTEEEKKILADVEVLGDDSECFENKIALCRDCHKEYDEHKTVEKYYDMLNLKKKLLKSCNAKTDLSHNMIEDKLFDVVKKISSLATDNDALSKCEPLSYNVMSIKEKIPFNNLLCNDVEGLVSSYFLYIKDLFKSLDNASFEAIASSFKHSYCQAVRQQLDQEDIFETLVQWVKKKTQCANSVARIVVSYFIQNCDVYGKLSR